MPKKPAKQNVKFDIKKIYLEDVSFESPQTPQVFSQGQISPEIDVQLRITHRALDADQGLDEVVLIVTVTAKHQEDTMFLVEVQQAGIFEVAGVGDSDQRLAREVACPNILLPFAREAISDLAAKGGFPQLLINPVNFELLYRRRESAATESSEDPSTNDNKDKKKAS